MQEHKKTYTLVQNFFIKNIILTLVKNCNNNVFRKTVLMISSIVHDEQMSTIINTINS